MEKDIETYVRVEIEKMGGKVIKWVSPGNTGVPDRIVLLPGGTIYFVEFKDERGRVSALQKYWLDLLFDMGFKALIIKGMKQARLFVTVVRDFLEGGASDGV
jgi:hypothetical protein